MFQSKTVFVIGAGASADLGMPLGIGLRKQIADYLGKVGRDQVSRLTGPSGVVQAILTMCSDGNNRADSNKVDRYLQAARHISRHIPLAESIDEFVDHYQGDMHIEKVAKIAICATILNAEMGSKLYRVDGEYRAIDHGYLDENNVWLKKLWYMLRKGANYQRPYELLENVSFINFNYDRSLELFLATSMASIFNELSIDDAVNMIIDNKIIIHPYGTVGKVGYTQYGIDPNKIQLDEAAENIRTYCESEHDPDLQNIITQRLEEARNIVSIGFAFHEQNMRFFKAKLNKSFRRIYATAYGIPEENWSDLAVLLGRFMKRDSGDLNPVFKNCKGFELLRTYETPLKM